MADVKTAQILEILRQIKDPDRKKDIVSLNMVSGIVSKDGNISFTIEVDAERGETMEPLRQAAEKAVMGLPGVISVTVVLTAPARKVGLAEPPNNKTDNQPVKLLEDIGAVIAVASGKGGVGKSTTSVNLALAFAQKGLRTAILDADIYGPSLPLMMGITEKPESPDGKVLLPIEKYGLKCMSIGFMVPSDTPTIWRGPMVMGALEQMMQDVEWGDLDVLVVDMPPGTGDAQLTMAQRVALAGSVIVSTPQDLALLDARKGLNMFKRVEVPVLGIIENMSYFLCPHCGEKSEIFTHGGARNSAAQMGVDFLGEIPLEIEIREGSDNGIPILVNDPDSPKSQIYHTIAKILWEKISSGNEQLITPDIIVE